MAAVVVMVRVEGTLLAVADLVEDVADDNEDVESRAGGGVSSDRGSASLPPLLPSLLLLHLCSQKELEFQKGY